MFRQLISGRWNPNMALSASSSVLGKMREGEKEDLWHLCFLGKEG